MSTSLAVSNIEGFPAMIVVFYLIYMLIWCISLELARRFMIAYILFLFILPIALLIVTIFGIFDGSDTFNTIKLFSVIIVAWIGGIARYFRKCLSDKTFTVFGFILYAALLINILEATITEISLIDMNNSYTLIYIGDTITSIIIIICTNLPLSAYINSSLYNTYVWPLDTEWCIVYTIWNFIFGFNRTCLNNTILWINALIIPLIFMISINKNKKIHYLLFWNTEKGEWTQNRTIALSYKKMVEFLPMINFLPFWNHQVCHKNDTSDTYIIFVYILNIISFLFGVFLLYFQLKRVIKIEENEGKLFEASNGSKYELSLYQLIIVKIKGIQINTMNEQELKNVIDTETKQKEESSQDTNRKMGNKTMMGVIDIVNNANYIQQETKQDINGMSTINIHTGV